MYAFPLVFSGNLSECLAALISSREIAFETLDGRVQRLPEQGQGAAGQSPRGWKLTSQQSKKGLALITRDQESQDVGHICVLFIPLGPSNLYLYLDQMTLGSLASLPSQPALW